MCSGRQKERQLSLNRTNTAHATARFPTEHAIREPCTAAQTSLEKRSSAAEASRSVNKPLFSSAIRPTLDAPRLPGVTEFKAEASDPGKSFSPSPCAGPWRACARNPAGNYHTPEGPERSGETEPCGIFVNHLVRPASQAWSRHHIRGDRFVAARAMMGLARK